MERQAQEMENDAQQRKREMEAHYPQLNNDENQPRGPESMHRMQEMLHQHQHELSEKSARKRARRYIRCTAAVQHQPPAVRLKGDLAMILRQRAERTMAQGGNFSGMDLTGVDFSGMDFRGANFEKALLECADLSHCQLDNASFQGPCWPERSYSIRRCVTVILAAPAGTSGVPSKRLHRRSL